MCICILSLYICIYVIVYMYIYAIYICYMAYVYMLYIHIHCVYALYIYHSLFAYSPKGHLGCCHFGVIRSRVTVNTGVQGLVGIYIFTFLGQIFLSEIAGLYGKCTFNSEKLPNCFAQRLSSVAVSLVVCEFPRCYVLVSPWQCQCCFQLF